MARKDLLIDLINSLSTNEKRYFSLFSSISAGEQNFKKLFRAMEGEPDYKARRIKLKLGETGMNLPYEKAYLQKVLLKSLRNYNEHATEDVNLHSSLIDVEVLFNKQQYEMALRLIKRTVRNAERLERFALQLQLLNWEKRCIIRLGRYGELEKGYNRWMKKEQELIMLLENLTQFRALQYQMLSIMHRKGNVTRRADNKKLASIIKHPLMKNVAMAKSFYAKMMHYEILINWHHHHIEFKNAYNTNRLVLNLFEQNTGRVAQYTQAYYAFISSYFNRALALDKMDEAKTAVDKTEKLIHDFGATLPASQIKEMNATLIEHKLIYFIFSQQYENAAAYAESLIADIEKPKAGYRPAFYIILYFYASLSFFHLKNYDKALRYQREILNRFDDKVRIDFVFMTHILHFLTHLELKNDSMLPYLLKSIQRFVKTRGLNNRVNQLVLKLFSQLVRAAGSRQKRTETLRSFYAQLLPYKNDHSQNLVIETLDLLEWMEIKQ